MVVVLDNGCSGVLVSEGVLVTAAHCGSATEAWTGARVDWATDDESHSIVIGALPGARRHVVTECHDHPDAELGYGKDVSVCILADSALDVRQVIHPASGCVKSEIEPGARATLVGYGYAKEIEPAGVKRVAASEIVEVGQEVGIGNGERGTCPGDSGSPAFIRTASGEWALVRILSSGFSDEFCGVGFYSEIGPLRQWIESVAPIDISPCFDANDDWQPSPKCLAPAIGGHGEVLETSAASMLCGVAPAQRLDSAGGCGLVAPIAQHRGVAWALSLLLIGLPILRRRAKLASGTVRNVRGRLVHSGECELS